MPHFRATNLTTNEVTEYDATLPQAEHLGEEWQLSEVIEPAPGPEDPPPPPQPVYAGRRILTKLEFLRLFTMTERITMRTAAKESPVMEDYLQLMDLAQEINLDDQDTVAGVQMMEQASLLAEGRAEEILRG